MTRFFRSLQSQHRAVLFAFLLLAAAGIALGLKLPAAILPEVTFPRITLIADSGERDTDEMLRGVTMPLEQSIRRVPGLHEMRSTTSRGSSEINLNFDWGSDMDLALSRVQALASSIRDQLPAGTSLDARLMSPTLFPVVGLSLTSPQRSQIELRDMAELQLRPALARLPGVSEVVLQGGRKPEVRVTLDVAALQARSLTVSDVADAVARALELRSLGLKEANRELYLALVDARPHSLEEVAAIPIPTTGGASSPSVIDTAFNPALMTQYSSLITSKKRSPPPARASVDTANAPHRRRPRPVPLARTPAAPAAESSTDPPASTTDRRGTGRSTGR